jgi:hypothetical protein
MSENDVSKQDKIKKVKVNNFLNYCHASNIPILPAYGLVERASKPETLELNKDRLILSEDTFWKKLGLYKNNDTISSVFSTMEPLKAQIYPLYAYLLMIKLIINKGTSRTNAKSNIQDLYEFTNKIGMNLVLPWQFAVAIFGGSTELTKFIKPKGGDVLRGLWGAAWDLFYIQLIHQYNGTIEIKGSFPRFILVTDDKACSTIGDFAIVTSVFDYEHATYHGVQMNSDFPHLRAHSNFIYEITSKINHDILQRTIARESMSELELQNDTEKIINRAHSFILEISEQIPPYEKKGFC